LHCHFPLIQSNIKLQYAFIKTPAIIGVVYMSEQTQLIEQTYFSMFSYTPMALTPI